MTYYTAEWIYTGEHMLRDAYLEVHEGRVVDLAPLNQLAPRAFRDMIAFEDALLMPGLVNAAANATAWITPLSHAPLQAVTSAQTNTYQAALMFYAEQLRQGVTTVADLVWLETLESGALAQLVAEKKRAALSLGIRLVPAIVLNSPQDWTMLSAWRNQQPPDQAFLWVLRVSQACPWSVWESAWQLFKPPAANAEAASESLMNEPLLWWVDDALTGANGTGGSSSESSMLRLPDAMLNPARPQAIMHALPTAYLFNASTSRAANTNEPAAQVLRFGMEWFGTGLQANSTRSAMGNLLKLAFAQSRAALSSSGVPTSTNDSAAMPMFMRAAQSAAKVLQLPLGKLAKGAFGDCIVIDLEHISLLPRPTQPDALPDWLVACWDAAAIRTVMVGGKKVYHLGVWQHLTNEAELTASPFA